PNAPGAPRALGAPGRRSENYEPPYQTGAMPARGEYGNPPIVSNEPAVGAPGGREPGAPLDLSTVSTPSANDTQNAPRLPQVSRDPA
ncbi:hypothetical protein NL526_28700, partial [Klebsiella pneumoniae]|nr:hypothetical protein [Klebsiella pneumoniae]